METKVWIVCLVMGLAVAAALPAQSNELIDRLLGLEQAEYGDSAYLALAAAGVIPADASAEAAMAALKERGWLNPDRAASDPISLGEYSHLLMRAFGMSGGIMYALFPGPRYAARELASLGLISGRAEPGASLSGERALRILERVASSRGGRS